MQIRSLTEQWENNMAKIDLKFEQVKQLAAEVEEIGRTMFLVKHNAIRLEKDGQWSVLHYEGLKLAFKEALPGVIYETDIPYTFWQEVLRQVNYYLYKKEQRAKAQAAATQPNDVSETN